MFGENIMTKLKKLLFMKSIHNHFIFIVLLNSVIFLYCTRFPLCEPCLDSNNCPPCISEMQIYTLLFVSSINLLYITFSRLLHFLFLCPFYIVHVSILYFHTYLSLTWFGFLLFIIYVFFTIYVIILKMLYLNLNFTNVYKILH